MLKRRKNLCGRMTPPCMLNLISLSGVILMLMFVVNLPGSDGVFSHFDSNAAFNAENPDDDQLVTTECEKYSNKCDATNSDCLTVENCPEPSTKLGRTLCYAIWTNDSETGHITFIMKGCWMNDLDCIGHRQCNQREREPKKSIFFCCCEGNYCNRNITFLDGNNFTSAKIKGSTTRPLALRKGDSSQVTRAVLYSIVPIIGGTIIVVAIFFLCKRHQQHLYTGHQQLPTVEPGFLSTPSETSLNLEKVELLELRARGRFGAVWKAQLLDEFVAVKIFPLQDKQSWLSEQEIYNLPQMTHENILRFIASEKRGENLSIELWMLTEFHDNGSLYDYLKGHELTWPQLCKIGESMARGLAFLHDEIPATNLLGGKPAIAHRDFKSKNVLLKADMCACIADFGLALKFEPGKGPGETHGLVGTRRYMAPEVLEGAICFNRDSFLRIDMYACGIVLWELLTRCNAVEGPVEEYRLPFENIPEIGLHPTLESMQEYVVTRKMRPPIREHWKKHSGMASLIATIEECWDQDAEARLSAGCVQERISYLSRMLNVTTIAMSNCPSSPSPGLLSSLITPLSQSPPRSNDSVISFSTSSDIPPKDFSSC